jgi:hypothetical protein
MDNISIKNEQQIQAYLKQISYVLLINGGFLKDPGLYAGEMGLVLFFFRYAHYTQDELYRTYGFELMDRLESKINQDTPLDYKQGLAGIGSAVEYLVQNDYIKADTDEILEDFDDQIFFKYNLLHLPIDKIMDIGYYTTWRLSGNSAQKERIRKNILPQIEQVMHENSIIPAWNPMYKKNVPAFLREKTFSCFLEHIAENTVFGSNMGIQDGLSGWGMSSLNCLDGDDSWFSLFPCELLPLARIDRLNQINYE